ncbi:A/G-specific adenine glycosylase [Schaedlerella sp.]|uniref:A/G-specific adenine glycosylase n=1 Tax=Schaedlerella sp. TaxID=2676057 RepID=UPI00374712A1
MKYERISKGTFLERPNRFIAYAELAGKTEVIHVKNTGRCAELLIPGASIYVQESDNPARKTKWDLIGVEKGSRMINMDSQVPNLVVKEWIESGHLTSDIRMVRPETAYGNSRFDLYVETGSSRIFIEVKGVTLEEEGVVRFPDAPSDRAVKHLQELEKAVREGYEAYVFFVIQMKGVRYFTPNMDTHPAFCEALKSAKAAGVNILAYDCRVSGDRIEIADPVPVVLESPRLREAVEPVIQWYRENHRDLPWRNTRDPYRIWVSEIMLQQTRVEAVNRYYERFFSELPPVKALAEGPEARLMKRGEGRGYYNRARNMQKAARQVMEEYQGEFPHTYDTIRSLAGIGNYTAGAVSSFAFGIPKPAVDGNVLRVLSRILASEEDIMKACVRSWMERAVEEVIPEQNASDFNQGLIELGALICVPNGDPRCRECPAAGLCLAREKGIQTRLPVKAKAKARRIEKRTVLIFRDARGVAIRKRPSRGLLAGLYELPNVEGHLTGRQAADYGKSIGLMPVRVRKLEEAKHIFSHVEWHMIGYEMLVDELEKSCGAEMIFAKKEELETVYSIPSAFESYMNLGRI